MAFDLPSSMDLPAAQRVAAQRSIQALIDQLDKATEASLSERRACRCKAHGVPSVVSILALDIRRQLGWEDDG